MQLMTSFGTTQEQADLRDVVRRFAASELAAGYLARAKSEEFPWALQAKLGSLGLLAMLAGPDWGGEPDPDHVALGLAIEALAYGDFNVANCALPVLGATSILRSHAHPSIQEQWMPGLTAGTQLMAIALSEPGSGSDAAAMRATARRCDGGFVLNGEKTSVTGLPHAAAAIVFATVDASAGAKAVTAFVVDLGAPGCGTARIQDTGWLPIGRGSLHLDDVFVADRAVIGEVGGAFTTIMNAFDFTRPLLALTAIGCAQATLDETVAYVQSREAFGSPLARFEGISFPLAEHATHLEAARLLSYQTLWARNAGVPHTAGAAMSKWLGPLAASRAVHDCLLMHGHYGYATENAYEQRLRDVLAVEIADGTAQVQKIVIARELFGRAFIPYNRAQRSG